MTPGVAQDLPDSVQTSGGGGSLIIKGSQYKQYDLEWRLSSALLLRRSEQTWIISLRRQTDQSRL